MFTIAKRATGRARLTPLAGAFVAAALVTTAPALRAQVPALPTTSQAPAPAPLPPPAEAPPSYTEGSPREALFRFLDDARRVDYGAAARYLDLTSVAESERPARGPSLARQLKVVLERTIWFDPEKISDDPAGNRSDGLSPNSERIGTIESRSGSVDVTLRRVQEKDGTTGWRFSSSFVERIPDLYDEFGYGWIGEHVPDRLRRVRAWGLELWQALVLLALVLVAWLVSAAGSRLIRRLAAPMIRRTVSHADDRAMEILRGPVRWSILVIFLVATVPYVHLPIAAATWVNRLLAALSFVAVVMVVAALVETFAQNESRRLEREGQQSGAGVVTFVNRLVKGVLAIVAIIGVLRALGFNVTGLLAGLGIGGVAVALAAQKTLENLFGGLALIFDKPAKIGDLCQVGQQVGFIEEFGFRSTRLRTLERSLIAIPNSDLSTSPIENLSARDRFQFLTTIQLRQDTSPTQLGDVLARLRRLLVEHPLVAHDDQRVRFIGFSTNALDVEIRCYVATADIELFYAVREELLLRCIDLIAAGGSGLAVLPQAFYVSGRGSPAAALPHAESA